LSLGRRTPHLAEGDLLGTGRQVLVRWLGFALIGEAKLAPQLAPNSIKWAGTTGYEQSRTPRKTPTKQDSQGQSVTRRNSENCFSKPPPSATRPRLQQSRYARGGREPQAARFLSAPPPGLPQFQALQPDIICANAPKLSGSSPRPAARRGWANVFPPMRTLCLPTRLARSSLFLLRGLHIAGAFPGGAFAPSHTAFREMRASAECI
jgi:hypothetical protein